MRVPRRPKEDAPELASGRKKKETESVLSSKQTGGFCLEEKKKGTPSSINPIKGRDRKKKRGKQDLNPETAIPRRQGKGKKEAPGVPPPPIAEKRGKGRLSLSRKKKRGTAGSLIMMPNRGGGKQKEAHNEGKRKEGPSSTFSLGKEGKETKE